MDFFRHRGLATRFASQAEYEEAQEAILGESREKANRKRIFPRREIDLKYRERSARIKRSSVYSLRRRDSVGDPGGTKNETAIQYHLCAGTCCGCVVFWARVTGTRTDAIDGHFAGRNCGVGIAVGFASGRSHSGKGG